MIKNLIIITAFIISSTTLAAPPIGSPLVGQLTLQSDNGSKTVPLPSGNWQVAHSTESLVNGVIAGSTPASNTLESVALVQSEGTMLKAVAFITANKTTKFPKYNSQACLTDKPNTLFYQNKYQSGIWDQRCLEVSHLVDFLNDESSQQIGVRSYINRAGLSFPSTVLRMQYTEYNQRGQFLRVELQINPAAYGFNDSASSYMQSPWHTDFLGRDQTRLSMMNDWSAYSQMYADALHSAFENNSYGQVGMFQPRQQSMGSNKSAAQTATAVDHSKTCMGIGFKPNTKALDDCVTELNNRSKK